jgi:ribosomal protein L32
MPSRAPKKKDSQSKKKQKKGGFQIFLSHGMRDAKEILTHFFAVHQFW